MFPINIVSVFFSNVKLSFLNHCAQVAVSNSDFFSTKNDDFYFKSKKKFLDGTDLLDGWIFRVLHWASVLCSQWSKQKGLQIEDLGSRIRSTRTHKKFRQIDGQTDKQRDRHFFHQTHFTLLHFYQLLSD